jgi:hypothetical protein
MIQLGALSMAYELLTENILYEFARLALFGAGVETDYRRIERSITRITTRPH